MDNKLKGITIRKNSVQISFTYKGVRCRESIKVSNPTKSQLKEIVNKLNNINYEISMGKFDYLAHFPESKKGMKLSGKTAFKMTIDEMIEQWFKRKQANWEYSTKLGYLSKVKNHITPNFGHMLVAEFTPNDYLDWVSTARISGKSKNEVYSIMKKAFQLLFNNDDIERNPFDRIERAKYIKQEPEPFNSIEREQILAQMTEQVRNIYEFAFWTGLRTGELLGLRRCDINLERKVIFVRRTIVKGREKGTKTKAGERTHELHDIAISALINQIKLIPDNQERIFSNPKTKLPWRDDRQLYNQCWVPALSKSGVKFRKQYNTRHTYASTMLTEGYPIAWIAKQLGHSSISETEKTYARWIIN